MYEILCADVNVNLVCTTLCIWLQWCGFTSQWSAPYCTNGFHDVYQRKCGYMVMVVSICFFQYMFFSSITLRRFFSILTVKRPKWFAFINCEFLFRHLRAKSCGGGHPKTCLPVSAELAARLRGGFCWLAAEGLPKRKITSQLPTIFLGGLCSFQGGCVFRFLFKWKCLSLCNDQIATSHRLIVVLLLRNQLLVGFGAVKTCGGYPK